MSKCYRVIFQTYEDDNPSDVINEELILDSKITLPTNCLDFTMGIKTQLSMLARIQNNMLNVDGGHIKTTDPHINYYGVPFNSRSLCQFVHEVRRLWLKSLRRRSQRHQTNWSRFTLLADRWIPKPKIVHPYPEQRFYATHPR